MYLVQAVTNQPQRQWSSYTNIHVKDANKPVTMNSTEEISRYSDTRNHYYSPKLSRRTAVSSYDIPEKSPKKDKKWSLGNFFRRKKKEESENSSSEDEQQHKKNFLSRRKKKQEKRKKPVTFDHVVIPPPGARNGFVNKNHEDCNGVFSEPTPNSFYGYPGRPLPKIPDGLKPEHKILNSRESLNSGVSLGSGDSIGKKRREMILARAEKRRNYDSSSDEDSQRSVSSSRFRSDESLSKPHDGSMSRRSRAARTERYIRRLSRDDENIKDPLRGCKSDIENNIVISKQQRQKLNYSTSAPLSGPNFSGMSTIPPPGLNKFKISNSTSNSSYKPPSSLNDYNNSLKKKADLRAKELTINNNQRSFSYDNDINRYENGEVMHIQLPIGRALKPRNSNSLEMMMVRQPPPPPPRDPKRVMTVQYFDNARPNSLCFEKARARPPQTKSNSFNENHATTHKVFMPNFRSTSEDHLPSENFVSLSPRPSSVTPEASRNQRFIKRNPESNPETYQYLTDKNPRSRKPIVAVGAPPQIKPLDFWKQKDKESAVVESPRFKKSGSCSPQMFTSQTHVRTKVFLPSVLNTDISNSNPLIENGFKPISVDDDKNSSHEMETTQKHKSSNLEEALNELEAIYNSLKLGDEDLLDRAEQQEKSVIAEKYNKSDGYPKWGLSGAFSDSNFSYEPFSNTEESRRKRMSKKIADRRTDDMAYRKLNKERANTINDPQSVVSKVSYLLASPVFGRGGSEDETDHADDKEPDITLDDVVYRNIKHANNSLKVVDPQPPFGIPLGPVTPAANSDYLHAIPEPIPGPVTKPCKIPDIVKDDLAFRSLRKDSNKEPALPPLQPEDVFNNNSYQGFKKRRAMRSLSANIFSLMHKEEQQDNNKSDSLANIAEAMEIARQILKDKENRINATKRAFMSDSESAKYISKNQNSSTETLTESRYNFLNDMKTGSRENNVSPNLQQKIQVYIPLLGEDLLYKKPPSGSESSKSRSPTKESTPIPMSPLEDKMLENPKNSFDDLLTALAVEARETSERITQELKQLEEEKNTKTVKGDLKKHLGDIDAVSEHAKLCEKLLGCVVDSTELIATTKLESTPVEEAENFDFTPSNVEESFANIIQVRADNCEDVKINTVHVEEVFSDSDEHDYENTSDIPYIEDVETDSSKSEEDTKEKGNDEGTQSKYRPRLRVPQWLRPQSCKHLSRMATMSVESDKARAERVARYKEERRKQLAAQFGSQSEPQGPSRRVRENHSSSSEGPKPTRTSRLRAAASTQETASSPSRNKRDNVEESPVSGVRGSESRPGATRRLERDKSSKRKSNLNRSLNSEEVPQNDCADDIKNRRRRRRFFPPEVLEQSKDYSSNDDKTRSDSTLTASILSPATSSPITASPTSRTAPRKSELRIHMENARRGVTPSYSEMGKYKTSPRRSITSSSPKSLVKSDTDTTSDKEINGNIKQANKENIKRKNEAASNNRNKITANGDLDTQRKNISKRMEELNSLTKETLARVERLTKARDSPKRDIQSKMPVTKVKLNNDNSNVLNDNSKVVKNAAENNDVAMKSQPSSILKNKKMFAEENDIVVQTTHFNHPLPVSILKRKVSQDDSRPDGFPPPTINLPVTFSPNVVEPSSKRQGILKKRRSLDESQVLRHRSCSPDVANNKVESRSILKDQRRSSLEEITRTQSPDLHLQSILKRKTSRAEEDFDASLSSPQSILKRRSGASSAGSVNNSPHVSIATAVILAAAGGAEMILNSTETVRPILKKKSFSDDQSHTDSSIPEVPKPILKKKSSTDTDDTEEKPKKPILKAPRNSVEYHETKKYNYDSGSECDVKPILKQREDSPRSRLSFSSTAKNEATPEVVMRNHKPSRRSNTICTDFNITESIVDKKEEDRELKKPRPLSVFELVMNFEKSTTPNNATSTGAIPKRSSFKRNSDRCRTQPITFNELEASLSFVNTPVAEDLPKLSSPTRNADGLLDFTTSLENDSNLNSFLSYSFHNTSPDSCVGGKMSSDSAFQSLGDGLELEEDDKSPPPSLKATKMEPSKLELQMKAIAEEAKSMRLGNAGMQKYRNRKNGMSERNNSSRFSTQPVTLDEVQEAARLKSDGDADDAEPSKLSLSERIKMFNVKIKEEVTAQKREVPRRRFTRFQTQPVTSEEVESARIITPPNQQPALDVNDDVRKSPCERKGILKSKTEVLPLPRNSPSPPKSVLKKRDSAGCLYDSVSPRSILKSDAYDEGISSNDSDSDAEMASVQIAHFGYGSDKCCESYKRSKCVKASGLRRSPVKFGGDDALYTSDGESSGGREVRSIINKDFSRHHQKNKTSYESSLLKSKSQGAFGDEGERRKNEIHRSLTQSAMPRETINELRAKLQQSGDSEWKKRYNKQNANDELTRLNVKNIYNNELTEKSSILATRKDELETSSKQWKSRVEKNDAKQFSVAGRMQEIPSLSINISNGDKTKRTPQPKRFKGKDSGDSIKDASSTPVSPELELSLGFKRSLSVPGTGDHDSSGSESSSVKTAGQKVSVPRPDDHTFKSFYENGSVGEKSGERLELSLDDLDSIKRDPTNLLVIKKNIQVQRRRYASKNPLRALSKRTDIQTEYTEVLTGVAEREKRRLNIEKLAKTSNMAIEALAGLASKEDFKSVALKKSTGPTNLLPYKNLMLLHIKGRRHIQTRLIEPVSSSINEGDNFILVTPQTLYCYTGAYSNVIEQSRMSDVLNHIQQRGDLGCKPEKVVHLNSKTKNSKDAENFWNLLGGKNYEEIEVVRAGHPDEDEIYETGIINTNMVYSLDGNELVPLDNCWGSLPKVDILKPTKVLVFDFGTEMYVWSGKNAPLDDKKKALKLAKEMWDDGFNYSECTVCPINVASVLGSRETKPKLNLTGKRPEWGMFAKLTQHRETILFCEKFLDWPDFSRIIRVKDDDDQPMVDVSFDLPPCDVKDILKPPNTHPDLIIEGTHLGRGDKYFDPETSRLFEYTTLDVKSWRVLENTYEALDSDSIGQFFEGDSYILRWQFRMNVMGRELSGKPSKHSLTGRDRTVFFCWQGKHASINEKGAAALLTVELDSENAPQIRVIQGAEPAAFLKLFKGEMVIHTGKREMMEDKPSTRLYMVRGEYSDEICLLEVPCSAHQLRSRTSFVLFNTETGLTQIWHGCKSSEQTKKVIEEVVGKIIKTTPIEFQFDEDAELEVSVIEEGDEDDKFKEAVNYKKGLYMSLVDDENEFKENIRLFHFSSVSGKFEATEILCPHRSEFVTPYPFFQAELYTVSQPALFMIDNGQELWLWQGWWPPLEEELDSTNQTGTGAVRWQAERRAAMQSAIKYWHQKNQTEEASSALPIYSVWAGLEPLTFTNLFPTWDQKEDIAELNIKDGKKAGEAISVEKELALLTRTTYPLAELLERPLPEGVDPTHLEMYLSPEDFQTLLSMTLADFKKLPPWKQTALKKEKGLF